MFFIRNFTPAVVGAVLGLTGVCAAQESFLVSTSSSLEIPNGASSRPGLSADGRYVVFSSSASNLAAGDTNAVSDVFWRDRHFGDTRRVSVSSSGVQGNAASDEPAISADGRFVVFRSQASNLTPGDFNNRLDIFLHDTQSGTVELVSVGAAGAQANHSSSDPHVSADGRYVVFVSFASNLSSGDTNGHADVFVRDRQLGTTTLVSAPSGGGVANGPSYRPRISADGRWVAYPTDASNLTVGDVNGVRDIVVCDLTTGLHLPVTANPAFVIGNGISTECDISAGGEYVAFMSFAGNLVAGDTNGVQDVFRWRRATGGIQRASVSSSGQQTPGQSVTPSISSNGLSVAFASFGPNLVVGDTNSVADVFVRDFPAATTVRLSINYSTGAQTDASSFTPALSGDAQTVCFQTFASNLYSGDSNGVADIVAVGDRCPGATTYCTAKVNSNGCTPTVCSSGSPTTSGPDDFYVHAFRVLNQKSGMLFWGFEPTVAPFFGGTRCVQYPVQRAPLLDSGGATGVNDCSGVYRFHFSQAYMQGWSLSTGQRLCAQFWSRDPFLAPPNNVGLTDAAEWYILP
jgi:Tol biopolymer transport system component